MSLPTALRSLTSSSRTSGTTERLRSDHILTLELFQETVDENAALREELSALKKRQASVGGVDESEESSGGSTSDAGLVQRVIAQDGAIQALTSEVKTLKLKLNNAEIEVRNLKVSSNSNEALRRELDAMVKADKERREREAVEASSSERNKQNTQALELQLVEEQRAHCLTREALEKLQAIHEALKTSAFEKEQDAQGRLAEVLEALATMGGEKQVLENDKLEAALRIGSLELKYKDMVRQRDGEQRVSQDRLHKERLAWEQERSHNTQLVSTLQEQIAALNSKVEDLSASSSSAVFLTTSSVASSSSSSSAPPPAAHKQVENDSICSFEEFIRLKKENKALKLQLAQATQSSTPGSRKER